MSTILAIILLVIISVMAAASWITKKTVRMFRSHPGSRRGHVNPHYKGPLRRKSDNLETVDKVEKERVKMDPSTGNRDGDQS